MFGFKSFSANLVHSNVINKSFPSERLRTTVCVREAASTLAEGFIYSPTWIEVETM